MTLPEEKICGIREIYRPLGKEPEVDIVAVHGLNGDALQTWTSKKSKVCWLSHPNFLPKFVKNARILVWGYNSSFSALTGVEPSANRIHHHAQTLVAQLYADRKLEGRVEKPIIFICHSLGGLVVKRALSYSESRSSDKIAHLRTIFTCTYGILFFGTPHRGSSKASLLLTLQNLTSLALPRSITRFESSLVSTLEKESETLQNITDYFVPLMKNFRIYFFWEQEKMDLKYTKDYIVKEDSAAPNFDDTERSGIAADHSRMVKFEHHSSPAFRLVAATLSRYCEEAPAVISRKWSSALQEIAEDRLSEVSEKLRETQSVSYMPQLPSRIPSLFIGGQEYKVPTKEDLGGR